MPQTPSVLLHRLFSGSEGLFPSYISHGFGKLLVALAHTEKGMVCEDSPPGAVEEGTESKSG